MTTYDNDTYGCNVKKPTEIFGDVSMKIRYDKPTSESRTD